MRYRGHAAPPLPAQIWGVLNATLRQLGWGLPAAAREIASWRARAQTIRDEPLRADALEALRDKRPNIEGAALFWILPVPRLPELLRLLVTYQTLWDYLDTANERAAHAGHANGLQLHRALVAALDPSEPTSEYYALHPWREDTGYLDALVSACRDICETLPAHDTVRPAIRQAATRCAVQALNHLPDPEVRDAALRAWAVREHPTDAAPWFELTASASASVTPYALLAYATARFPETDEILRIREAYESVSLAIAMLDSYADLHEDVLTGSHSYLGHYASPDDARQRLREIIAETTDSVRSLANGERHAVLVASMVALYLTKGNPRTLTCDRAHLARAGGSLTTLLLPILAIWRACYSLRDV